MATSMLPLRALIRCQPHPLTCSYSVSAAYSTSCLTGSVKSQWSVTSLRSTKLTGFASRPFSSKPEGVDVALELENATNEGRVGINLSNTIVSGMGASSAGDFGLKIVGARDGNVWVEFNHGDRPFQYSLSQICPMIFSKFKMKNESSIGRPFSKAVILVPSYFNDAQRHEAKNAATIAGFDVHRVITRASPEDALPYGIEDNCLIGVLDLSGRALDFGLKDLVNSNMLLKGIVGEVQRHGYDVTKDPSALQRVKEAVENAWVKKSAGIKIHLPVAAGKPEKSLKLGWTKLK